MQKQKFLIALLAFTLFSVGTGYAYAQGETPDNGPQPWHVILAFVSFIASGVLYSSSGWIKTVRRKLAGTDDPPINYKKMGKSILIGVILGLGAMIWSIYNGDVIVITTGQELMVQIGLNTTIILLVDKWILGRGTEGKAGPTGDNEDEFEDLWDELPVEVPPGKTDLDLSEPLAVRLGNLDPNKMMFKADKHTTHSKQKTVNGMQVQHIAEQPSRRTRRKKKTIHVFNIEGTDLVIFNQSRDGVYFMKIAIRPENVKRFYETFVKPPVTPPEKIWLDRYGYELVN